jgi:hypothetical protein
MNLLDIHPSFWTREKVFTTWQFIRLSGKYKDWIRKCELDYGAINLIKASPFGRYLENYPPESPDQTFSQWYQYAVKKFPSDPEVFSTPHVRVLHMMSGYGEHGPMSRLPKNWPPIPADVVFPHPWKLDTLTPTSIGCAVIVVPRKRKHETPFIDLSPLTIGNTEYGLGVCAAEKIAQNISHIEDRNHARTYFFARKASTARPVHPTFYHGLLEKPFCRADS